MLMEYRKRGHLHEQLFRIILKSKTISAFTVGRSKWAVQHSAMAL